MKKKIVLQKLNLNKEKIMPLTLSQADQVLGGGGPIILTQAPKPTPTNPQPVPDPQPRPKPATESCLNCTSARADCPEA